MVTYQLILWLLSALHFTSCMNERYYGHKVVQLNAPTRQSFAILKTIVDDGIEKNYMDVWAESPNVYQVQMSSMRARTLQNLCRQLNITVKVIINNVKKAIDDEMKGNEYGEDTEIVGNNVGDIGRNSEDNDDDNSKTKENNSINNEIGSIKRAVHPRFKHYAKIRQNNNSVKHKEKYFHYNKFNRYTQILKEVYRLKCLYPKLLDVSIVGHSYEGRKLILVKISKDVVNECKSKKKIVWIDGGTHAREWISVSTAMYMMREFVSKYGKDEAITKFLRNHTVYIAPLFNPDGYEYTFTDDRLWRKTRTPVKGSNCVGTDPNRNWEVEWGGNGTSRDPCHHLYRGEYPESEPVVKAFASVLRYIRDRLLAFWTFHSYSQLFLFPNSYTNDRPKDRDRMELSAITFYREAQTKHGRFYIPGTTIDRLGQTLTGVSIDYVHDKLNVTYSFLIELRPGLGSASDTGFLLPTDQIIPTSQEAFHAFLKTMETIDTIEAKA